MSKHHAHLVPPGSEAVRMKGINAVVYFYEHNGSPWAMGFCGLKRGWEFKCSYTSPEERRVHASDYLQAKRDLVQCKKVFEGQWPVGMPTGVGNILVSENEVNDGPRFFAIVSKSRKARLRAREVLKESVNVNEGMAGVVPLVGQPIGSSYLIGVRLSGFYLLNRNNDMIELRPWDGEPVYNVTGGR